MFMTLFNLLLDISVETNGWFPIRVIISSRDYKYVPPSLYKNLGCVTGSGCSF